MFGLTLTTCQLIQGPAVRTWNCVAHFANLLWYKFNHVRHPIMPRQRRRHHSRSRSRSLSPTYDREREPKRRKIESYESPQHKRSLSPQTEEDLKLNSPPKEKNDQLKIDIVTKSDVAQTTSMDTDNTKGDPESKTESPNKSSDSNTESPQPTKTTVQENILTNDNTQSESNSSLSNESDTKLPVESLNKTDIDPNKEHNEQIKAETTNTKSDGEENAFVEKNPQEDSKTKELETKSSNESLNKTATEVNTSQESDIDLTKDGDESFSDEDPKTDKKSVIAKVSESKITPKKTLSPKQLQKKLEIEKRREEQRVEREKKKQQQLEELLKLKQERERLKQEKQEHKQKEIEFKEEKKKKEREEKEQKRKEKEEKIEQKRKEKEEKDEQKRKEQEEKNKEKQKLEEKKQKAAAVFVNFFTKKNVNAVEEKKPDDDVISSTFMPFEVKSDMRLAPITRMKLTDDQRNFLTAALENQTGKLYLEELKKGRKTGKTWPAEESDDVIVVEDMNPGESIEEQPKIVNKLKAKFLKFNDNRRPAYFGTWRKKSKFVKPRRPLALDKAVFDYEYDSDEDWEEEEEDTGESLRGSDDEDKENESGNEYEVDNEFFVPHGHLSDDEVNDEEGVVISPEAHKAKLKLLKKEFEEEMQGKTQKIKPKVIGCIWYNKERNNVDCAIREFLKPLSIISNGPIIIKKRNEFILQTPQRGVSGKPLSVHLIPDFLKVIHGNTNNSNKVITEFLNHLRLKNSNVEVSKNSLKKQWKQFADWIRCPEDGPMLNKHCWYVRNEVKEEYNVDLVLPNK